MQHLMHLQEGLKGQGDGKKGVDFGRPDVIEVDFDAYVVHAAVLAPRFLR